jgi:hypothetical protein
MRLISCLSAALLISTFGLTQSVVLDADAKPTGATSRTTIVRSGTSLYNLSIKLDGALRLLASQDAGASWKDTGFVFNDKTSGIGSGILTNYCCLAVDSRGWLHASWRRASYPSFYSQYYRNVNPKTLTQGSNIIDVQTSIAKQSATTRSGALGLAIDSKGHVWMLATGSSWMAQLLRSDLPYAPGATPAFSSVGNLSGSGTASQNPFVVIDSNDFVHCLFHYASGTRSIGHNAYDPSTKKWSGVKRFGTPANNNSLAATDRLGNLHALYGVGSGPYTLEYMRWDATAGWGKPVQVTTFTKTQLGTSNSAWIFTIGVHAVNGTAYAIYRDFAGGGAMVLASKSLQDASFRHVTDIMPASAAKNVYYMPNVRGSLQPFPSNSILCDLDLVYYDRSGTKARLIFEGLDLCSTGTYGTACKGSSGTPSLSFGALPRVGKPFSIELSSARATTATLFFLGGSNTSWGAIPLPFDLKLLGAPGCSLYSSLDASFGLATDAKGAAAVQFSLPNTPGLANSTVYTQFLIVDPGANNGNLVMTEGGRFTIRM